MRGIQMNENRAKRNDVLSKKIIDGLASRNMTGYYAQNKEEALRIALSLIPEGSTIARGGSMSVNEIGLTEALENGNYKFTNREKISDPDAKRQAEIDTYDSDIYLCSANAITTDGVIVNIDGNANRVSAFAYGPRKVIAIVGMNKVAADVDAAMKRARNEAAPINAQRFGLSTPCTKTGMCMNCRIPDTICCQFLITRYSKHNDRIHVILVDDNLGF